MLAAPLNLSNPASALVTVIMLHGDTSTLCPGSQRDGALSAQVSDHMQSGTAATTGHEALSPVQAPWQRLWMLTDSS